MAGRIEQYFLELVNGERQGLTAKVLLTFLRLLALPYAGVLRFRALAYRVGLFPSHRLPRPVIAVGNITAGGTGKTPTVAMLARYLMARGKRVAVISRGYGGSLEGEIRIVADGSTLLLTPEEAGDEPCLLAESVPGLMVVIGTDRYRAGLHALEQLNPDIFILDDGFQHLRLQRDLNILLLDCRKPFGNGWTLPAGLLREPVSAVARGDLVIYTRCGDGDPIGTERLAGRTFCRSFHRLTRLVPLQGGDPLQLETLRGKRGLAFAGIADPSSFFSSLEAVGLTLAATLSFPDHTGYGKDELAAITSLRRSTRPDYLVTTEKDAVKLARYREFLGEWYGAVLEVVLADPEPLHGALEKYL